MNFIETKIKGVFIIEPKVITDSRGYFMENFRQDLFDTEIGEIRFIQENESLSSYGVVRGLHFQKAPFAQGKLCRVIVGEVMDVAVDLRPDSPTFGQYVSVYLNEDNKRQLYIPKGLAHGYAVTSKKAVFAYRVDDIYAPQSEGSIRFNDPQLNISWPIPESDMILSEKDSRAPFWKEVFGQ